MTLNVVDNLSVTYVCLKILLYMQYLCVMKYGSIHSQYLPITYMVVQNSRVAQSFRLKRQRMQRKMFTLTYVQFVKEKDPTFNASIKFILIHKKWWQYEIKTM